MQRKYRWDIQLINERASEYDTRTEGLTVLSLYGIKKTFPDKFKKLKELINSADTLNLDG